MSRDKITKITDDLREALEARFEDGSSIAEYILLANPALATRLRNALNKEPAVTETKEQKRCPTCGHNID